MVTRFVAIVLNWFRFLFMLSMQDLTAYITQYLAWPRCLPDTTLSAQPLSFGLSPLHQLAFFMYGAK